MKIDISRVNLARFLATLHSNAKPVTSPRVLKEIRAQEFLDKWAAQGKKPWLAGFCGKELKVKISYSNIDATSYVRHNGHKALLSALQESSELYTESEIIGYSPDLSESQ